jgi:hypothetical protein
LLSVLPRVAPGKRLTQIPTPSKIILARIEKKFLNAKSRTKRVRWFGKEKSIEMLKFSRGSWIFSLPWMVDGGLKRQRWKLCGRRRERRMEWAV